MGVGALALMDNPFYKPCLRLGAPKVPRQRFSGFLFTPLRHFAPFACLFHAPRCLPEPAP